MIKGFSKSLLWCFAYYGKAEEKNRKEKKEKGRKKRKNM